MPPEQSKRYNLRSGEPLSSVAERGKRQRDETPSIDNEEQTPKRRQTEPPTRDWGTQTEWYFPVAERESSHEYLKPKPPSHTVLITGTSNENGIGNAILKELEYKNMIHKMKYKVKEDRYKILAPGRDELELSITDPKKYNSPQAYIERHKHDGIDIIINNAGVNPSTKFEDMTEEEMTNILNVNIKAAALLIQGFAPGMIEKGGGKVTNVGSIWGRRGRARPVIYSASKYALRGLTLSTAALFGKFGILVNQVDPGVIDTDMTRKNLNGKDLDKFLEQVPLGRVGETKEIAIEVLRSISDKTTFRTGTALAVDGGFTLS